MGTIRLCPNLLWVAKQLKLEVMELTFKILAVILIGIAAFFLWQGNYDAVFVSAVFGAVCFFLSIRFEVGKRVKQRAEGEKGRKGEEEKDSVI